MDSGCSKHIDVNATTRIHDSLTFLGATWVGHEMALYLELYQCSNSITHQDFAPNQSSYGSSYIVKWNQQQRMKNRIKQPNRNEKESYCTEQKNGNKARNTNCNQYTWKETLETKKLPNENWRYERRTLIERSLLDFETWRSNSCHLEPCSKISEGVPPLEAHHCSQDKAKEEEDSRLTISL